MEMFDPTVVATVALSWTKATGCDIVTLTNRRRCLGKYMTCPIALPLCCLKLVIVDADIGL